MQVSRHIFTFRLRTLFVLTTILVVWFGVVVNRAYEQREAVRAMKALGAMVFYDWQLGRPRGIKNFLPRPRQAEPPGPKWLRRVIGDEFFQDVDVVYFYPADRRAECEIVKSVRSVRGFRKVQKIFLRGCTMKTRDALKALLPDCEVKLLAGD